MFELGYDMNLDLDLGKSLGWTFVENLVEELEKNLALDFEKFDLGSMRNLGDFSTRDYKWVQTHHS